MKPVKAVVIQTALRPMFVYADGIVTMAEDFEMFFSIMKSLVFDENTRVYVNRGPGSYSGIRTGIAYVMGLLHGQGISSDAIKSFTSFDLIRAAVTEVSNEPDIYIKAWPRIANGKLTGSKGYKSISGTFSHGNIEASKEQRIVYSEEPLTDTADFGTFVVLLPKDITVIQTSEKLMASHVLDSSLEPLYINPVHIT